MQIFLRKILKLRKEGDKFPEDDVPGKRQPLGFVILTTEEGKTKLASFTALRLLQAQYKRLISVPLYGYGVFL